MTTIAPERLYAPDQAFDDHANEVLRALGFLQASGTSTLIPVGIDTAFATRGDNL